MLWTAQILILLVGTTVVETAAESAAIQLQELSEGYETLQCSGCKMIARALQSALDSKLSQRFKKLTKAERLDATAAALRKTCRFSPVGENGALPERVIRMGTGAPNSTKEFLDQGEAWRLDSKAEWVNPKVQDMQEFRFADSKKLLDICFAVVTEATQSYDRLVQKLVAKQRQSSLSDFRMFKEVCINVLQACPKSEKLMQFNPRKSVWEAEDEYDDEDEDREL